MPKLHTPNHDIPALEQRLKDLLEAPPERVVAFPPKPGLPQRLVRRFAASGPLPRKIVNGMKAWKLTGYSLRWIVLKIPMVRPVAVRIRGRLQFRRVVMNHLLRLDDHVRQLNHQQSVNYKRLENMLRDSNQAMTNEYQVRLSEMRNELASATDTLTNTVNTNLANTLAMLDKVNATTQQRLTQLEAGGTAVAEKPDFADYYVSLENLYRGESSAIEERFEPYLKFIRDAGAGTLDAPVLDLGCGRGEWLSVLRRAGLNAIGVDSDADMLAEARARQEHVVQGDLLRFIEAAAPESYGAVTTFQVVEHLPLEVLMRLFAGAARALKPGGVIVFETPNPENIQVASYSFWLDPTHVRPLPPPLLDYFARYFGFMDVQIVRSHPWPAELHLTEDTPANRHLNKLLFCEQDYALVARKPI
jgi:O-antigen chain-terminating methyltransferase